MDVVSKILLKSNLEIMLFENFSKHPSLVDIRLSLTTMKSELFGIEEESSSTKYKDISNVFICYNVVVQMVTMGRWATVAIIS